MNQINDSEKSYTMFCDHQLHNTYIDFITHTKLEFQ